MVICVVCVVYSREFVGRKYKLCCSQECNKLRRLPYLKNYRQQNLEHQKILLRNNYIKNKDKYSQIGKERRKTDEYKKRRREYTQNHKEEIKKYQKNLKNMIEKKQSERKRNLGFNPLNEYFENSEAHHINKIDVIYIPINWHFRGHNVHKNINMEPINTVAFFFLLMQNIQKLNKLISYYK